MYGPAVLYEPSGKAKEILGSKEDFFDTKETMMMMTTRMMKKTIRIWTALAAAQPLGS